MKSTKTLVGPLTLAGVVLLSSCGITSPGQNTTGKASPSAPSASSSGPASQSPASSESSQSEPSTASSGDASSSDRSPSADDAKAANELKDANTGTVGDVGTEPASQLHRPAEAPVGTAPEPSQESPVPLGSKWQSLGGTGVDRIRVEVAGGHKKSGDDHIYPYVVFRADSRVPTLLRFQYLYLDESGKRLGVHDSGVYFAPIKDQIRVNTNIDTMPAGTKQIGIEILDNRKNDYIDYLGVKSARVTPRMGKDRANITGEYVTAAGKGGSAQAGWNVQAVCSDTKDFVSGAYTASDFGVDAAPVGSPGTYKAEFFDAPEGWKPTYCYVSQG